MTPRVPLLLLLSILTPACTGSVGDADPASAAGTPGGPPAAGGEGAPRPVGPGSGTTPGPTTGAPGRGATAASARVRRLTTTEIGNAARDIFLGGAALEHPFPAESTPHKFGNQFDQLGVPLALGEALQAFSEKVGAAVGASLDKLSPCAAGTAEAACAKRFVDAFGPRVYRRPLASDEAARLEAVYAAARKETDHKGAIGAVVEAMLQSPHFLFRTELGAAAQAGGAAVRLTPHELAAALSFFLWQSTPDDALLDAAAKGKLATRADVEAQARRMLADPRAKESARSFFLQWLEVAALDTSKLSTTAYREFGPKLLASMKGETAAFFDDVFWSGAGGLEALLTAPRSFVDADLAKLYGVEPRPGGALAPVAHDPGKRAGFLTQAAFLATYARPGGGFSPVFLGQFVRGKLFCEALPPPPNDVPALPPASKAATTRERFGAHSKDVACSGCHLLMDPLGWGFERYDALGRYRETENDNVPLTGQGEIIGTDVPGPFAGPVGIARKLAGSAQVKDCFAGHLLEYAVGRAAAAPGGRLGTDRAALEDALGRLAAKGDLRELLVAIAASDALAVRDAAALPKGGAL